jgi:hypothetical protein
MSSCAGGDTTDYEKVTINNLTKQELAIAAGSSTEPFGPESNGPVVRVEFVRYDKRLQTFRLQCGLAAAGGEHDASV